jgi:hypothetical protein
MADAGSIYESAFSDVGKNIGNAITQIYQQRQQLQQMDALVNMGNRYNWSDITGNPADAKAPLVPPKIAQDWTAARQRHDAKTEGQLEALMRMRMGLGWAQAGARVKSEFGGGNVYRDINTELAIMREARARAKETETEKARGVRQLQATQKSMSNVLKLKGVDPTSIFAFESHRAVGPSGSTIEDPKKLSEAVSVQVPSIDERKFGPTVNIAKRELESWQDAVAKVTPDPRGARGALNWLRHGGPNGGPQPDPNTLPVNDPLRQKIEGVRKRLQELVVQVVPEPVVGDTGE